MKRRMAICGLLGLTWPASLALAQAVAPAPSQPPPSSGYVTREEYDKLKSQMDTLSKDMATQKAAQTTAQTETDASLDGLEKRIREDARSVDQLHLGTTRFMLAGDGEVSYTSPQHGDSTFSATFAPLFIFELDKNFLFEGALDISGTTDEAGGSSTDVGLALANLTYTTADWLYIGGGVFAVPFANFHPHGDASWINLLPDEPLVFGDRALAPSSETGVFLGGAVPVEQTQVEYNAYVTNGPSLNVGSPDTAGTLNFDDFTDLNNNKAVGGRVGFLPVPYVDVGYSIQYSNPAPSGFDDTVHALLQAGDVKYKRDIDSISGTLTLQGEWVWSDVSGATYDPDGTLGYGPLDLGSRRSNGGYALIAYRPSLVGNKVLKNTEFVARYDAVFAPEAGGGDEDRWTFGVDYWVTPGVVLKVAYQFDNPEQAPSNNILYFQTGFAL